MKTNLNLVTLPGWRERFGLRWAIPTALAAVIVLGLMVRATASAWQRYRHVKIQVKTLDMKSGALQSKLTSLRSDLNRPRNLKMFRDTRLINRLIADRKDSIESLLRSAVKPLTANVRLTGLAVPTWPPSGGAVSVQLQVQAKSERDLEAFVSNLEQSPAFNNVAVKRVDLAGSNPGSDRGSEIFPGEEVAYVEAICVAVYTPSAKGVAR